MAYLEFSDPYVEGGYAYAVGRSSVRTNQVLKAVNLVAWAVSLRNTHVSEWQVTLAVLFTVMATVQAAFLMYFTLETRYHR